MEKIFVALGVIIVVVVALSIYLGYLMGSTTQKPRSTVSPPQNTSQRTTPTVGYKSIEITSAYISNVTYKVNSSIYYEITLEIRNKGTINITLDKVFVNNKLIYPNGTAAYWVAEKKTLSPNEKTTIYIYLSHDNYSSGQVIQIILHTKGGKQFPTQVTLP